MSETAVLIRDMPQHEPQHEQQQLDSIYTRVSWRLMPLFLAVMILNHVDRTNLAYACKVARHTTAVLLLNEPAHQATKAALRRLVCMHAQHVLLARTCKVVGVLTMTLSACPPCTHAACSFCSHQYERRSEHWSCHIWSGLR